MGKVMVRVISIHALREESDNRQKYIKGDYYISIHALREESDILRFIKAIN